MFGFYSLLVEPDYPQLSRVMRIKPRPDEQPAAGFSWADYEDVDDTRGTANDADGEDDGGWGVVKSRRPSEYPLSPVTRLAHTDGVEQRRTSLF